MTLEAQRLEDHALGALAVPFAVEDALPGAEIEAAGGDGDDHLVTDGERAQVRGGVVLAGAAVVTVRVGRPGRDALLEPLLDVLPEAGLVIVDEHRGGDMHGGDEDHPLGDVGFGAAGLDVIGDVDDLLALRRLEDPVGRVGTHGSTRARVVAWCGYLYVTANPPSRAPIRSSREAGRLSRPSLPHPARLRTRADHRADGGVGDDGRARASAAGDGAGDGAHRGNGLPRDRRDALGTAHRRTARAAGRASPRAR